MTKTISWNSGCEKLEALYRQKDNFPELSTTRILAVLPAREMQNQKDGHHQIESKLANKRTFDRQKSDDQLVAMVAIVALQSQGPSLDLGSSAWSCTAAPAQRFLDNKLRSLCSKWFNIYEEESEHLIWIQQMIED